LSKRKVIDKEFERALPDVYTIIPEACTKCGDCVPVCPTGAIDLEAESRTDEQDFGAVFLATGVDPIDLSRCPEYASSHPNVVTGIEFERLLEQGLERPSDGEEPERVVFVQCAGSRAGPDKQGQGVSYCSRTCCSVTAKQVDRLLASNPVVEPPVVYYRDMRTYERALEALYQNLRNVGVPFVNGEVSAIEGDPNGSLKLSVDPFPGEDDEKEAEPAELDANLVVLATAQVPSHGSDELYRMFG